MSSEKSNYTFASPHVLVIISYGELKALIINIRVRLSLMHAQGAKEIEMECREGKSRYLDAVYMEAVASGRSAAPKRFCHLNIYPLTNNFNCVSSYIASW